MDERIAFLLNAASGRGKWDLARVRRLLDPLGGSYEVMEAGRRGEGTEAAREAVSRGMGKLIVFGGDGTVNEAVTGLAGSPVKLGIVPVGTGNDVARSLGLPVNDPPTALERALGGTPKAVDAGRCGERYFLSMLGVGFVVPVVKAAGRWRRMGRASFVWGVYRALAELAPVNLKLVLDERTIESECTAIMVQNTPFIGGGLPMAPSARIDDGCFDVVVIGGLSRAGIILNFPRVIWGGHLSHPAFEVYRSRRVRIVFRGLSEGVIDGERIDLEPGGSLEAEIVPGAVMVMV